MKTIPEILQMTEEEYEILVYSAYLKYCESKTFKNWQIQMLMISNQIFQWWQDLLPTYEARFREIVAPFIGEIDAESAQQLYLDTISETHRFYVKPFIKNAITREYE